MDTFSFSRLSLYETCPYRFYQKYVEGFEEPITYPLALGKAVHKAIEDKMNGASHDEAITNGIIEVDFHPDVTKNELSSLVWKAPIKGKNKIVGETEVYFKIPLSDEENAPKIQGFIDVVGGNFIYDWKTNRIPYDVRDNHQISLYSWAMKEKRGLTEVYGTLYFLRFRRSSSYRFSANEMEESRKWAYGLAKEIQGKLEMVKAMPYLKEELFPATPRSFCSHCPFVVGCFRKFSPIAKSM